MGGEGPDVEPPAPPSANTLHTLLAVDDKDAVNRRMSTNTQGTTYTTGGTAVSSKSFLQRATSNSELNGNYVDELPAEDVGFSFNIRAPAEFGRRHGGEGTLKSKEL